MNDLWIIPIIISSCFLGYVVRMVVEAGKELEKLQKEIPHELSSLVNDLGGYSQMEKEAGEKKFRIADEQDEQNTIKLSANHEIITLRNENISLKAENEELKKQKCEHDWRFNGDIKYCAKCTKGELNYDTKTLKLDFSKDRQIENLQQENNQLKAELERR